MWLIAWFANTDYEAIITITNIDQQSVLANQAILLAGFPVTIALTSGLYLCSDHTRWDRSNEWQLCKSNVA